MNIGTSSVWNESAVQASQRPSESVSSTACHLYCPGCKTLRKLTQSTHIKRLRLYDMPDHSVLPPGQLRAVTALIGGGVARTYPEAARIAGMAEGTLLTHVNRVRQNHPRLYSEIRAVRMAQLAVRHQEAVRAAQSHTTTWFRKRRRRLRLYGIAF